jgi:hypothetical protein
MTIFVFLAIFLIASSLKTNTHDAWSSMTWFLITVKGLLWLACVGLTGVLSVWIAFVFNPSEEEAESAAEQVRNGWSKR